MNLLRDCISGLRCSPYGCTAARLDPNCSRSQRFLSTSILSPNP